jgi:predicted dehydrogenase/threonine dehydrogenase-like Zn-dependent dehydrogenase
VRPWRADSSPAMKQVIRRGLKEIIVDEVPDPVAGPHHVVVSPHFSLISSGTETADIHHEGVLKEVAENPSHIRKVLDVMKVQGPIKTFSEVSAKFSEYAVLGYSGAGIVVEKHSSVDDLEIGDRVAYGGEGTGHGERILTGRNLVARVPEGLGFDRACFATLGSIAMNAVRIAAPGLGDTVAVIGQGLVGQLVSQLAKLQGAIVIAMDLRPERVDLANVLGADHAFIGDDASASKINSITEGRGVDCTIISAAAKSAAPCQQALRITRDRGRIVVVGAVNLEFPWGEMYRKEMQLFMARAYGPGSYDADYEKQGIDYPFAYVRWTENRNMEEFLRLAAAGRINLDSLVTHRFPLEQAPAAYQTILDPQSKSLAVLLHYPEADQPAGGPHIVRRRIEISAATPASGKLQVALIGAGNLARWEHLPNIKSAGANVKAIYSANGTRGKSYGIRFGAAYCCTDYQEILNDRHISAVVITSRNQQHAAQALAALESGKHVFVEKPMALTEEECRMLGRAVASSGRILSVGFNRRFAPDYVALKTALKGRAGPAVLNCRINSPGISGTYWMADPSSGGAILGEACHFIDLMHWLLDAEPVSVSSYSLPTDQKEPIGINNLSSSFLFDDGSIGNLTYCTVGSKTSGGERVEVYSEGLGAVTEDFKTVRIQRGRVRRNKRMFAEKGYAAQMRDFFDAIRNGRSCAVTFQDGARATIGCLRMLEAARTRQPCTIELATVLD